jgi:hypothetical protein
MKTVSIVRELAFLAEQSSEVLVLWQHITKIHFRKSIQSYCTFGCCIASE